MPPAGTRGPEMPKALRPIIKAMMGTGNVMFSMGRKIQGRPLVRLTTIGARTGKRRRTIVASFPGDERSDTWVIVASNGGSARHPSWAYNLAKNPEATLEIGKESVEVRAELITDPEREVVWNRIVALAPGFGAYTTKTDRVLPLFRLSAQKT